MSTGNTNYPTRDAPYIRPETLESAQEVGEKWRSGCQCGRAGLCIRCLAAAEIERLHAEASSWKAVAHDHSERLKVITAERDRMKAMLKQLAGECARCDGSGTMLVPDEPAPDWANREKVPCDECADIRAALGEAS